MPWRGRRCTHRIQPDQGNTTPHFFQFDWIYWHSQKGGGRAGEGEGGGMNDEYSNIFLKELWDMDRRL